MPKANNLRGAIQRRVRLNALRRLKRSPLRKDKLKFLRFMMNVSKESNERHSQIKAGTIDADLVKMWKKIDSDSLQDYREKLKRERKETKI